MITEKKRKILAVGIDETTWGKLSIILRSEGWKGPAEYLRFKINQDVLRYHDNGRLLKNYLDKNEDTGVTRIAPDPEQRAPEGIEEVNPLNFLE